MTQLLIVFLDLALTEGFLDFDRFLGEMLSHFVGKKQPSQAALHRPRPIFINLFLAYKVSESFFLLGHYFSKTRFKCSTEVLVIWSLSN